MLRILSCLVLIFSCFFKPHLVTAHEAEELVIIFTDQGFSPTELEIHQGDTVTFKNQSSSDFWPASDIHPTHEIYPEFDPKKGLPPGSVWQFTPERPGRWKMHDHLHPQFLGEIVVLPAENETQVATASVTPQTAKLDRNAVFSRWEKNQSQFL